MELLQAIRRWVHASVRALPAWVRYPLSVIAFWPTALYWRAYCALYPAKRRWWDRITPGVILGAVPLTEAEVLALRAEHGVRGIVNLCREWDWHGRSGFYAAQGLAQVWLPTIDFSCPDLPHLLAGAAFIAEMEAAGSTAYCHCKAGRGRSTCVVIAYLVLFKGMRGEEAQAFIQARRPHVSKKWHLDVFRRIESMADEGWGAAQTVKWASASAGGGGASSMSLSASASAEGEDVLLSPAGGTFSEVVAIGSARSSLGAAASARGSHHSSHSAHSQGSWGERPGDKEEEASLLSERCLPGMAQEVELSEGSGGAPASHASRTAAESARPRRALSRMGSAVLETA
jgi:atypical dual specificity phosphatase